MSLFTGERSFLGHQFQDFERLFRDNFSVKHAMEGSHWRIGANSDILVQSKTPSNWMDRKILFEVDGS